MISKLSSVLPKNIPWLQWIGCLAAFLLAFVIGLTMGWNSPYLSRLTAKDSPLLVTADEASWLASISNFGRILGAVFGAIGVECLGSKRTLFLNGFSLLLSWVMIIVTDSVTWLYASRMASGLSLGAYVGSLPVYLGEVSSPKIRGTLISLSLNGCELGTLMGNVMGAYLSMSLFAWISLAPTIVTMAIFLWIPESPHHLIRAKKIEDARRSMLRYNPGVNADVEFEALQQFASLSSSLKFVDRLKEFNTPKNRKCGFILVMLFILMQTSGINSFIFYQQIIITNGKFEAIAPATMVMILALLSIISGFVVSFFADTCGRRILWNVGCGGTSLSLVLIGVHFTLLGDGFDSTMLQWFLTIALILWQIFIFVGPNAVPSMILSELFAPNIKSLAACVGSVAAGLSSFVSCKSYQLIVNGLGDAYVFWIHAIFMAIAVVFGLLLLPETKAFLLTFIMSLMTGWASPYVAKLTADDSPLLISMHEASWVVSVNNFGRIFGGIFSAISIHYFGSRITLLLAVFPILFSWTSIIIADSVIWLYMARVASGFTLGVTMSAAPLYLGEVCSPGIRGALVCFATLGYPIGTLMGTVMGTYLSISQFVWVSLVPTIVTATLFFWIPDSPHYLTCKGRTGEAQKSMLSYNPSVDIKAEFVSLQKFVSTSNSMSFIERLREFNVPRNRKAGILVLVLFALMQASGSNTVTVYLEIILRNGQFTATTPATMVIVISVFGIIAGIISMYLADTCGRRILWNITTSGTCASLIIMAMHLTFLEKGFDTSVLQWLFVGVLVLWQICIYGGIFPVPNMILSEVISPDLKTLAASITSSISAFVAFLFSRGYQVVVDAIGETYVYWIQAVAMGVALIFGWWYMPETKGKSLQEIQDLLTNKEKSKPELRV